MTRFMLRELEVTLDGETPELDTLLSHLVTHATDRFEPRASVHFRLAATSDGAREIFENGESKASKRVWTDALALSHIHYRLHNKVLALYEGVTCLHCAAATIDGRLALFTGDRGSGKTTLSLGLLDAGASFHCDEMLLASNGQVLTVPRPLHVKQGTLECLPRLADACANKPMLMIGAGTLFYPLDPTELGYAWQSASGRPAAIFSLRPAFDAPPVVDAMTQIGMVKQLMEQMISGDRNLGRQAREICSIVNGVPCFSLRVGDLLATTTLVRRTLMSIDPR